MLEKHLMKIRGLLTGLLLALAVTGCTGGSPTTSEAPPTAPAFDEVPPPPPPDSTANRGGGGMGTGT